MSLIEASHIPLHYAKLTTCRSKTSIRGGGGGIQTSGPVGPFESSISFSGAKNSEVPR